MEEFIINDSPGQSNNNHYFQESTLTIIHCQHTKGNRLVILTNFSFFPHILQRHICRCFFILKSMLLFTAVTTPADGAVMLYRQNIDGWLVITSLAC
jgi:hypothetical protein